MPQPSQQNPPPSTFWQYLRCWICTSLRGSLDIVALLNFVASGVLWVWHKYWPASFTVAAGHVGISADAAMSDLAWQIPLALGGLAFAYRLVRAPFEIHYAQAQQIDALEAEKRRIQERRIELGYYLSADNSTCFIAVQNTGLARSITGVRTELVRAIPPPRFLMDLPVPLLMIGEALDGEHKVSTTLAPGRSQHYVLAYHGPSRAAGDLYSAGHMSRAHLPPLSKVLLEVLATGDDAVPDRLTLGVTADASGVRVECERVPLGHVGRPPAPPECPLSVDLHHQVIFFERDSARTAIEAGIYAVLLEVSLTAKRKVVAEPHLTLHDVLPGTNLSVEAYDDAVPEIMEWKGAGKIAVANQLRKRINLEPGFVVYGFLVFRVCGRDEMQLQHVGSRRSELVVDVIDENGVKTVKTCHITLGTRVGPGPDGDPDDAASTGPLR